MMLKFRKNISGLFFFYLFTFMLVFSAALLPEKKAETRESMNYFNGTDSSATIEILMKDEEFVPKEKTIGVGTTVKWINKDNAKHNVASGTPYTPTKQFHSKRMKKGDEFIHKFDKAGTYPYFCTYHEEMTGTITVK
jgi:plastocyanin